MCLRRYGDYSRHIAKILRVAKQIVIISFSHIYTILCVKRRDNMAEEKNI